MIFKYGNKIKSEHLKMFIFIVLFLLIETELVAQSNWFIPSTSVTLSNSNESQLSNYTIVTNGVNDGNTGNSMVITGRQCVMAFPAGTDVRSCSGMSITFGGTTYNIPIFYTGNLDRFLLFEMPFSLPPQSGFTLTAFDIINPPINLACGTSSNAYFSNAPCDDHVYLQFPNVTFIPTLSNGYNFYHHVGFNRFSIQAAPYFIQSVTESRTNTNDLIVGNNNQEMISVNIKVTGSTGTLPNLFQLLFNTGTTTNYSAIRAAKLYSTGTENFFPSTNDVLMATFNSPNGVISYNTFSPLQAGDNYFFLVYDIECSASFVNENMDLVFTSTTIDWLPYFSTTPSNGIRNIAPNYTSYSTTNLVPNPSFEIYSSCPTFYYDNFNSFPTDGVLGWESPGFGVSFAATSDYFNVCDTSNIVGVPTNVNGNQAARTGNAYAGIGYWSNNSNEYLQIRLSSPLIAGIEYALSFYTSLAENSTMKRNGLGARVLLNEAAPAFLNIGYLPGPAPVLVEMDVIRDEVAWHNISGTFVANGGEEYLLIGTMLDENSITVEGVLDNSSNPKGAYYFIDDVSLVPSSSLTICPTLLPVELLNFTATEIDNQKVKINWEIASEFNLESYTIERSTDAKNWSTIRTVKPLLNEGNKSYEIIDNPKHTTYYYYRLGEITLDGDINKIKTTGVNLKNSHFTMYPNPVADHINIYGISEIDANRTTIYDQTGRRYYVHINDNKLDVSALKPGVYFLKITLDNQQIIKQFIKT